MTSHSRKLVTHNDADELLAVFEFYYKNSAAGQGYTQSQLKSFCSTLSDIIENCIMFTTTITAAAGGGNAFLSQIFEEELDNYQFDRQVAMAHIELCLRYLFTYAEIPSPPFLSILDHVHAFEKYIPRMNVTCLSTTHGSPELFGEYGVPLDLLLPFEMQDPFVAEYVSSRNREVLVNSIQILYCSSLLVWFASTLLLERELPSAFANFCSSTWAQLLQLDQDSRLHCLLVAVTELLSSSEYLANELSPVFNRQ